MPSKPKKKVKRLKVRRASPVKPKAVLTEEIVEEVTGDKCSMCGRITDSIMQSRCGYVCECCYESSEEVSEDRW